MVISYKMIALAVVAIVLDVLTGVGCAMYRGEYQSSAMREGGKKKLGSIMAIVLTIFVDIAQMAASEYISLDVSIPVSTITCLYLMWMEIMSMCENLNKTWPGVLPEAVSNMLHSEASESGVKSKKE